MTKRASLEWKCEALTPIWTGNVDGVCAEELLESAVIGSMRWWLEAWARGAGFDVPDPIVAKSIYSAKDPKELDIVSRVFGATGWRRRFRLVTEGGEREKIGSRFRVYTGSLRDDGHSSWFYNGGLALTGKFTLRVEQTSPWDPMYDATSAGLLDGLLSFMAEYGTIGAKPQLGLGVFRICRLPNLAQAKEPSPMLSWLQSAKRRGARLGSSDELPNLLRFRFGEGEFGQSENNWEATFERKAWLRSQFRLPKDNEVGHGVRHALMGTVQGQPTRAKLVLSHPFVDPVDKKVRRRAWGWVPAFEEDQCEALAVRFREWPAQGLMPAVVGKALGCTLNRHDDWAALQGVALAP
jgi:CRISPR type III-B/RAMP module RAMP protein Cmr1